MEKSNGNSQGKIEHISKDYSEHIRLLKENIDGKLSNHCTKIDKKIANFSKKTAVKNIDLIKYLFPSVIGAVTLPLLTIVGINAYSHAQFNSFKEEVRRESNTFKEELKAELNEFLDKSQEKPEITLLASNRESLENQTIEIKKVAVINSDNNRKLTKPRYRYRFTVFLKNLGKGFVRSEDSYSILYYNSPEPERSCTDEPMFNDCDYLSLGVEHPITKLTNNRSIFDSIRVTTSYKPQPAEVRKLKLKLIYGDREVSSTFFIKFANKLRYDEIYTP